MNKDKANIGRRGEEIAVSYLKEQGYEIVELNWEDGRGVHCQGEIDIIALKGDVLSFIEVKLRQNSSTSSWSNISPESGFTVRKAERMRTAITSYLKHKNYLGHISVCLVAINYRSDQEYELRFYENIRF